MLKRILLLVALTGALSSCSTEPWRVEMTRRLDSMVVLSESHERLLESVNRTELETKAAVMGDLHVFFIAQLDRMDSLEVPKAMYTGPLKQMKECNKYYGRVLGSYSAELDPGYNTNQLKKLRKDVRSEQLDSTTAVRYFNDEAFALRSADRNVQKSYGGCFTCLRVNDSLVNILDSLKGFILEPDAVLE